MQSRIAWLRAPRRALLWGLIILCAATTGASALILNTASEHLTSDALSTEPYHPTEAEPTQFPLPTNQSLMPDTSSHNPLTEPDSEPQEPQQAQPPQPNNTPEPPPKQQPAPPLTTELPAPPSHFDEDEQGESPELPYYVEEPPPSPSPSPQPPALFGLASEPDSIFAPAATPRLPLLQDWLNPTRPNQRLRKLAFEVRRGAVVHSHNPVLAGLI